MQDDKPRGESPEEGEVAPKPTEESDPMKIIADAIRRRVVTVSADQAQGVAEDVMRTLKQAGYELRKKK